MPRRWGLSIVLAVLARAIYFGVALLVGGRKTAQRSVAADRRN